MMKDHLIEYKRNSWRMNTLREGASTIALCILVLYSFTATFIILRQYQTEPQPTAQTDDKPSFLPLELEDLYNYLENPTATCKNYTYVEGAPILKENVNDTVVSEKTPSRLGPYEGCYKCTPLSSALHLTDFLHNKTYTDEVKKDILQQEKMSGHEGTYICMDGIPASPTQASCRMYSFAMNRYDIKFEVQMGNSGCRVHLISGATEYSFSEIGKNLYLYPIDISEEPGGGMYTIDNFMDLMNHQRKPVHYVRTTLKGAEWIFLKSLYKSEFKAYDHIKQIRLLVHLPLATNDAVDKLNEIYSLLMGMPYYGYRIVYSRAIPGTTYTHATFRRELATKYEVVWIKD